MATEPAHFIFGKNINRLRTLRKWTQDALAEKADIHPRYLQKIEAGQKRPTINTAAKLRFALDCTWDELMQGISGDPYGE